jgi:hypothetical protein
MRQSLDSSPDTLVWATNMSRETSVAAVEHRTTTLGTIGEVAQYAVSTGSAA